MYADRGNISAISGKACIDKRRLNMDERNRKNYGRIVGATQSEPEVSDMAQKLMVRPID